MTGRTHARTPSPARKAIRLALAVGLAASGLQCFQDFVSDPTQPPAATAAITVTPPGASLAAPGGGLMLNAVYRDADGNEDPGMVFDWTTLNPAIATVDPRSGVVTAVGTGQVAIAATAAGVEGYALVTVSASALAPGGALSASIVGSPDLPLNAVWGGSTSDVWVAGDGVVLRGSAGTWTTEVIVGTTGLTALWGPDTERLFVVGEDGTILRRQGGWSPLATGTDA